MIFMEEKIKILRGYKYKEAEINALLEALYNTFCNLSSKKS